MELDGKAAIVTGASRGVGRATALRLARAGCRVMVNHSQSEDAAQAVAEEARRDGVEALAYRANVADDAACREMVEQARQVFGRLDVLVNNAGTTRFIPHGDLEKVRVEDWEDIMAVNLRGPFQCTRAARGLLAADGGGEVVMTSSVAGLVGTGSSIPYCASKAALNNLTLTLARVLAPQIRVNAVAPGFIDGEWLKQGLGDAYETAMGAMRARTPLDRVCEPDDVAAGILGIITGPDLVTGHVLPIEGGMIIGTS